MEFPTEFRDGKHWKITKNKNILWLELSTGEEKKIGFRTIYAKNGSMDEKILEINIFGKGAVAQMWFPDVQKNPKLIQSRILKNGAWIQGMTNAPVELDGLYIDKKFGGVRISLKISQEKIEIVDIYKI